jgi:hypothetical protein
MKQILHTNPVFTPGTAGAGTLSFNNIPEFNLTRLLAVLNVTRNAVIYGIAQSGVGSAGYSAGSKLLTLQADTSTHNAGDILTCLYEPEVFVHRIVAAASVNSTVVKGSRGVVYAVDFSPFYNLGAGNHCLQLYDLASPPTPWVNPPKLSVYQYDTYTGINFSPRIPEEGVIFQNGIGLTISTGAPTYETSAVANAVVAHIYYA